MTDASAPDRVQLLSRLLVHMRQVVGDGACDAMLRYGAVEEGKRFGAGTAPEELPAVLRRMDAVLRHRLELVADDGASVTVRVRRSGELVDDAQGVQGILLGLVEGALTASRAARFSGTVRASDGELLLVLTRQGGSGRATASAG